MSACPIVDGASVQETCLKTVIIFAKLLAQKSHNQP